MLINSSTTVYKHFHLFNIIEAVKIRKADKKTKNDKFLNDYHKLCKQENVI